MKLNEPRIGVELYYASGREDSIEAIERKGLGHPDTIADAISEAIQIEVLKHSRMRSSDPRSIPYAYSDKTLVVCGESRPKWGGGRVLRPIRVVVPCILSEDANVGDCEGTVRAIVSAHVPLYPVSNIEVEFIRRLPSAHSLRTYAEEPFGAEDSCISVAHAPRTRLELAALELEGVFTRLRKKHPAIGTDTKWQVYRIGRKVHVIAAVAFIDRFLTGLKEYRATKSIIERTIGRTLRSLATSVDVSINPDDRYDMNSVYLTVTGSSIEGGDCGATGRGNRSSGLIYPMRPMTLEAASGKPSRNHPSRFGSLAAEEIAESLSSIGGVRRAEILIVSKIGERVWCPDVIMARLVATCPLRKAELRVLIRDRFQELISKRQL